MQRGMLRDRTNLVAGLTFKHTTAICSSPTVEREDEYDRDTINHFLDVERVSYMQRLYMDCQPEITEKMRKILVDWLVDVCGEFKVHLETFFLAIDIIDRYLCLCQIPRGQLQLLGIAAVLIAAKHEEVWPPVVKDCVAVTAYTYTAVELIDMERSIACALQFRFTVPTSYGLAMFLLKSLPQTELLRTSCVFFLECAAHSYSMLSYTPSGVACAALYLAAVMVDARSQGGRLRLAALHGGCLDVMRSALGHVDVEAVRAISAQLLSAAHQLVSPESKLKALYRKYNGPVLPAALPPLC